jgi:hypothetical protein
LVGGLSVLVFTSLVVNWLVVSGLNLVLASLVVDGAVSLVLGVVVVGELWGVLVFVVFTSVVGHVSLVFVVDGTFMGLSLELNMGLLLVVLLIVGVGNVGLLVVDGVVVNNAGLVVVGLVVAIHFSLDVVSGILMTVLVIDVLTFVVNGLSVVGITVGLCVFSVVIVVLVVSGLVSGLVMSGLVMDGLSVVLRCCVVTRVVIDLRGLVSASVLPDGVGELTMMGLGEAVLSGSRKVVTGDVVLHLTAKEDLGESETNGVTELIEVLVLPLGLSIHDLVMDVLSVHNKIVLDVVNEVPRVSECLRHLTELVKISADSSLALLELVSNVMEDMSEILNTVKNGVESSVLELVNDTTEALPDVLGITEALNTVRNFSLNGTSEHTLEDLAHAEESEVNV